MASAIVSQGFCAAGSFEAARCLPFLDFQFDVLISSQGSTLAGVPSGRNLREGRFAFERLRHMSIDFRTEALRIGALCGIKSKGLTV